MLNRVCIKGYRAKPETETNLVHALYMLKIREEKIRACAIFSPKQFTSNFTSAGCNVK